MRVAGGAMAIVAAIGLTLFALLQGTWAVGGSDSSCYGLMAEAFARGQLQPLLPLATHAPWSNALQTFAPGGFIASPVRPDAASPICAPGFSLFMVPFRWLGGADGIFVLTPLAAGLLVWFAYVSARDLAGPVAGAASAIVIATTGIVLFQAVQPMNDITTTTLWMSVVAAAGRAAPRRWWLMGALTGLAVLVRPNLAPVAVVVGVWVVVVSRSVGVVLLFGLAASPAVLVMAVLNWALYGSPFRVGYGNASDLFAASNVTTNLVHYGRAGFETLTPFPLLALAAPLVVAGEKRAHVWLSLAIASATILVYLLYRPFEEWWYLRFLLPAVATAIALSAAVLALLVRRPTVVVAVVVALAVFGVHVATERQATDLDRLEARFRHTGHAVRDRLPANSLFFTVWESGSVRYHAQREAILWDSLDPDSLDTAVTWVRQQGYEPYLLLERWEEPSFRDRFGTLARLGNLDWPPRYEIDRQVRIYAPSDRAAYLAGHPVPTEQIVARQRW